jgi:hypothetical protein
VILALDRVHFVATFQSLKNNSTVKLYSENPHNSIGILRSAMLGGIDARAKNMITAPGALNLSNI